MFIYIFKGFKFECCIIGYGWSIIVGGYVGLDGELMMLGRFWDLVGIFKRGDG